MTGPGAGGFDAGLATVWAAAGVAVVVGLLVIALDLGAAIAGRHRAEAAADLAALAAAGHATLGVGPACERAQAIAVRMGGRVTHCELSGWVALVEVEVPLRPAVIVDRSAHGRARAGPADPAPGEAGAEVAPPSPLVTPLMTSGRPSRTSG